LALGLRVVERDDKLAVGFQALGYRLVAFLEALKLHETGDFSHDAVLAKLG